MLTSGGRLLALMVGVLLVAGCESRTNQPADIAQASFITVENLQQVIEGMSQGVERFLPANLQTSPVVRVAESRDGYTFALSWSYDPPSVAATQSWFVQWYVSDLVSASGSGSDFQPIIPGSPPYNVLPDAGNYFVTNNPLQKKLYQFALEAMMLVQDAAGQNYVFQSTVLLRRITVDLRGLQ